MDVYANRLATFLGGGGGGGEGGGGKEQNGGDEGDDAIGGYWPHIRPKPEDLAAAGFIFVPSVDEFDNVRCFICDKQLDGWTADDEPLKEHLNHSKSCAWALTKSAGDVGSFMARGEDIRWDPNCVGMVRAREGTYRGVWPHESKRGWIGKVKKMAKAGFHYTPTPESDDMVTCVYCGLGLDGWEPKDDPVKEHKKRKPDCTMFVGFEEEDISTTKQVVPRRRASKVEEFAESASRRQSSRRSTRQSIASNRRDTVISLTNVDITGLIEAEEAPVIENRRSSKRLSSVPATTIEEVTLKPRARKKSKAAADIDQGAPRKRRKTQALEEDKIVEEEEDDMPRGRKQRKSSVRKKSIAKQQPTDFALPMLDEVKEAASPMEEVHSIKKPLKSRGRSRKQSTNVPTVPPSAPVILPDVTEEEAPPPTRDPDSAEDKENITPLATRPLQSTNSNIPTPALRLTSPNLPSRRSSSPAKKQHQLHSPKIAWTSLKPEQIEPDLASLRDVNRFNGPLTDAELDMTVEEWIKHIAADEATKLEGECEALVRVLEQQAERAIAVLRSMFYIDDLPVLFPYERIYPEQFAYMSDLKKALDAGGNALLEMPSGTGKTVSLLSLIISYQQHYPEHRKLIYCSRTMSEIEKALAELKNLMAYREEILGEREDFRGIGLTSRKNLCLHPEVKKSKRGDIVDARCRSLTAAFVREKIKAGEPDVETCIYHDNLDLLESHNLLPSGVYTLDDLLRYGELHKQCPYFTARRMMTFCNVIIYSYHYLLDPKIAERVSKELSKDCIVVFDEAHNIDNVCIESLSIDIYDESLRKASKGAQSLERRIEEMKKSDSTKLQKEYENLVQGLRQADADREEEAFMSNPVLPDDLLKEAVPGNIRRAEHFVAFLKRFIEYLKTRMKVLHVIAETPTSFLAHVKELTFIEKKPLRFCSERLTSLVRTLELTSIEEYQALTEIATFATLVSTYEKGFLLILEPFESETATVPNPVLHFTCLDASIAMKPVFERFSSVIITSGTISPLDMYPKMLNFSTVVQESYSMTLARKSYLPMVVTRGSDQVAVSSKFEVRNDPSVVRNYGNILIEFAKITPDGLVCFFPSYLYMESIVSMWQTMGVLDEAWRYKLILVETPDSQETSLALETYRTACNNGRGAVLLCVARGKVSEGVDFDHQYGRAVIMFGIPYQYTESRILKARLEFLRDNYRIKENDFLTFDAMRHAAQCLGRVLRGKDDYGVMVLADKRFGRADKRQKLPKWINQQMSEANANISTDMAIVNARKFLRSMAQPFRQADQEGISQWSSEHLQEQLKKQAANIKKIAAGPTVTIHDDIVYDDDEYAFDEDAELAQMDIA